MCTFILASVSLYFFARQWFWVYAAASSFSRYFGLPVWRLCTCVRKFVRPAPIRLNEFSYNLIKQQVRLYYGSGTGGRCCRRCVSTYQVAALLYVQWRHDRHLKSVASIRKVRFSQLMHVYSKNIPAKLRLDPIWNDWALGFLMRSPPARRTT